DYDAKPKSRLVGLRAVRVVVALGIHVLREEELRCYAWEVVADKAANRELGFAAAGVDDRPLSYARRFPSRTSGRGPRAKRHGTDLPFAERLDRGQVEVDVVRPD